MDKKEQLVKKDLIDDKEDLEIQKVAYNKNYSQNILLCVLIILFCTMLSTSIMFINNYYKNKANTNSLIETIEIKSDKNYVLITNNGEVNETITTKSFAKKEDLVIEKINIIDFTTNKKAEKDGTITFNVKYNISKNDFFRNEYASNDSEVLVRFSYSFDNEEWTYVNNVISTSESTLSPLMGNYYDISGITSTLNVATNYELSSSPGETIKMYWRSETTFKYKDKIENNKVFMTNFKIEYKDND